MFQKMYDLLFNAITTAIEEIKRRNYGNAERVLIEAQRETEELFISCAEEKEDSHPA